MAGVVAHLAPHAAPADREARAQTMLAALAHRGGVRTTVHLHGVVLGTTARGDADDAAVLAQDGWAVAIAGHVDDGLPGPLARPTDVAQALLEAFARDGLAVPNRMRGAFAAVVTDGRTLWAWRDHVGFGLLFYRVASGRAWVATEAKAVLEGAELPREPDLDVVESIFYGAYDDDTPSALRGAWRLPKASLLVTDGAAVTRDRYWDPAALLETRPTPPDLQGDFDRLMTRAVSRVMRGDDVVSLSGGVDSTAVVAYGARLHRERFDRPLGAVSAIYPTMPSVDESEWIELVARMFELPLTTYQHSAPRLERLDRWVRLFDGPVPTIWFDEVEESYRQAARIGAKQVLTGEFAEYVIEMRAGLVPYLVQRGRLRGAARFLAAKRRGGARSSTLAKLVLEAVAPEAAVRFYRGRHSDFGGLPTADFVDPARVDRSSPTARFGRRELWRREQLRAFSGPGLSLEADEVIQDVCGVRVRRPWLDIDLWEYWLSLRAEDKFPGSRYKALIKQLLRGRLPDELLDRKTFTSFDEAVMAGIDYPGLRRWLAAPGWRMPGVDYARLQARLEAEDLSLTDYVWARDLAAAHAFVEG